MNKNLIEKIAPQLTELMIKKMETLTEEWRKPWIADLAHGLPRNLRGTPYRGGNILMLLFLSEIAGYSTPLFMTFKQAKEEGLNILKGSGSFPVFFWKLYIRHKETRKKIELADYYRLPQEQRRQYDVLPVMRYYPVFNIDQTDMSEQQPERYASLTTPAEPKDYSDGLTCEVLDQALLRPGRFDRRITIDRPNLAGRIATLEVHTRNIKLGEDVDLKKVALATAGCVGADLANIVNEAALRAVRKGRKLVTQEDMLAAFEFVIAGSEKKNSVLTEFEKKLVAYHEVGHAMVAYRQKNAEPVQKITIVPHTEGSLGYTLLMPEEDKTNLRTRDELMAKIAVSMGGRAAEEVIMHTMTNGASQDIQEATNIARNMVAMYGMSDEFGMMALGSVRSQYLDGGYGLDCAQETAAVMDKAVKEILEKCYADAVKVIEENIDDMHKVVAYLLEKETITGGEMVAILEGRDPATVEDAYASTRRSDSDFRPSVPSTIEAPARHISMTSEKIEMPPLDGEAPDESAASDAENGKNAETPAEETPAQDAPAGDGAETPDHE